MERFTRVLADDVAPWAPSIQVAYQQAEGIVLEGIGRHDVDACAAASDCTRLTTTRLPRPPGAPTALRLEAAVEPPGRFLSWCAQFDRFRVAQSRLDPLPEPDWMVGKGQHT